jgi:DNA-binding SARP family transcriptional activator
LQESGRTRIQLCGRLTVELDGRRLEDSLPARQGRLLFAYLALNSDRAVRRHELVDCVWPARPPADPGAALSTLISRLRHALGPGVVAGKSELSLALPPGAEIDVRLMTEALERARGHAADEDWQRAWGPAHAALAIARRGLLPGLEAPWIDRQRNELEEVELQALELVAETGLGLGGAELGAAERAANALVARTPFRESGHRLRMRLLAARGNVAEALQAYEEVRQLLRDELGASPSAELMSLHKRLLAGDQVPTAARAKASDFFGRRRELDLLAGALAEASQRRRRVVLLAGEPGIGKTRLAEELAERAIAAASDVVWGRCHEGSGAPAFWPWVEVTRGIAARKTPEQLRRALGPGAADLAQIAPELNELLPGIEPRPLLDPEAARFRLDDSLDRFLVRVASSRPLVLVLDDLQWGDEPSLEALRFVATRPDDARLLVVGTYRTTELDGPFAGTLAALAGERSVSRLELTGLAESELAELLSSATCDEVSETLAAAVHHRTGGNPFYASQLVRLLDTERDLSTDGADSVLRLAVPGGVRDVVRRRLERLSDGTRELLTRAAVVGEEFELELVASDQERALDLLETALAHHVVAESATGVGRFRFSHALVREALYADLSAVRKARLHREVGEALEALHGDDADRALELAHHFYEAAPAGMAERAYRYAVRAADVATDRLAYEQAEHQLRRAVGLLGRTAPGRERAERELDLQVRIGALLMMTDGYAAPAVGEACARAHELCREVGNEQQLLASLWRLGVFYEVRADFTRSGAVGEQLLERGEPAFRLAGRQMLGVVAVHGGRPDDASEHLLEARDLADELGGLHEVFGMDFRVTSRAFLAWARALEGDGGAGELAEEALARARLSPSPHDEAYALFMAACCAVLRRDTHVAGGRAGEAVTLCSERGFRLFGAMATVLNGWALAASGSADGGAAATLNGLTAFRATGARMMLPFFHGLLAEAYQWAGRLDDALAAADEGLSYVDSTNRFYEGELRRLRGELLQRRVD